VDGTKVALTASAGVGAAETLSGAPIAVLEKSKQALKTAQASGHDCVVQANQFAAEEAAWRELAAPGRLFERTVARDVMLACTVVLHVTDSIGYAQSLFQQTHLACMVVVEGDQEFAGTASAEDVAEYLQASGDPDEPISRIMVRGVDTVKEAAPFADLMGYFAGSDSELVVVVDGNRPTGIVSAASLAALSQAPQQPACCAETPSMGSSYLQVAEPLDLPCTTDTV
jgi:CBS domain-containing protein